MSNVADDLISVLISEDSDFYFINIKNQVDEFIREYNFHRVQSIAELDEYIDGFPEIDLLILDLYYPDGTAMDKLQDLKLLYPDILIIVVSGQTDIRLAFQTVELGANYYVVKGETFSSDFMVAINNAYDQIKMRRELSALRNKVFAIENYPTALFHLTDMGVEIVKCDFEEFPESLSQPEDVFLQNMAVSFMLVIGQGHNYHEGCFNVPAGESKFFTSLLFVFKLKNPGATDERLKIGYYQICIFVPNHLFSSFPPIASMNPLIDKIKAMVIDSNDLINNNLGKVKQMLFDEIKFMKMR